MWRLAVPAITAGAFLASASPLLPPGAEHGKGDVNARFDPLLELDAAVEVDQMLDLDQLMELDDESIELVLDPSNMNFDDEDNVKEAEELFEGLVIEKTETSCTLDGRALKRPYWCQLAALHLSREGGFMLDGKNTTLEPNQPFNIAAPEYGQKEDFPSGCNVGEFFEHGKRVNRVFWNPSSIEFVLKTAKIHNTTTPICFKDVPPAKDYLPLACPKTRSECTKLSYYYWCPKTCTE